MKKLVSVFMTSVIVLSIVTFTTSAKSKYGFTYDTKEYNDCWKKTYDTTIYSELGGKLGVCSYNVGLLREKKTNNYAALFYTIMTPNEKKVPLYQHVDGHGRKNLYGYGYSDELIVRSTLPSRPDSCSPSQTPKDDVINVSVGGGASKDGYSGSIGASYSVERSDLNVKPSHNNQNKLYKVVYDYKVRNIWSENAYIGNESVQLGTATFEYSPKTVGFRVYYDVKMGCADHPWRSRASDMLRTFSKTISRDYAFEVNK